MRNPLLTPVRGVTRSERTDGLAVRAEGLAKTFGRTRALDGVDLEIPAGTVLGLLGPNGAGKTTTVRILTTLLRPDAGRAWIDGHEVTSDPDAVRRRIGLSGQYAAVDDNLTGYENLYLVARLHGLSRPESRRRCSALLHRFRLDEDGRRPVKQYSGGMRRRLDLAGALIAKPAVVILDEPTTGLDPRSRQDSWDLIGELVAEGTTVLLTTQYLEEADRLADTIAVINAGRVIAFGSPDTLKARIGGERLELVVAELGQVAIAREVLAQVGVGEPTVDHQLRRLSIAVDTGPTAVVEALRRFGADNTNADPRSIAASVQVLDVALRRPTLDEVFLALTGERTSAREGA
jgi:ABC-2 type transport system ATP-binding protein